MRAIVVAAASTVVAGLAGLIAGPAAVAAVLAVALALSLMFPVRSDRAREVRRDPSERPGASPAGPHRSLDEATAALSAAFESLPIAVLVLDGDLSVLSANDAAVALFGTPHDAMIGRSLIRAGADHNVVRVAREHSGYAEIVEIDGDHRWIATAAPLSRTGSYARIVLSVLDRSALKTAERARTDLAANLSHELRTPITAALAIAETLEGGVDDPARRERFHEHLRTELERLSGIVTRLLRLSRLEGSQDELLAAPVDPVALLTTARARIEPALRRGQQVVIQGSAPLVLADSERVLEVLVNLIDNAARFSPDEGRITLSVREVDGACAEFEVADEGPGILPGERSRVFERFFQSDGARSVGEGGAGLGLSIARHIVERHGGTIRIGDGSPGANVQFTIPLAKPAERPGRPAP